MKLIKSRVSLILNYRTYKKPLITLLLILMLITSGCVSKSREVPVAIPTQVSVQLPDNLMTTPSFQNDLVSFLSDSQ
ncbi:TPA: Rz1-like spanin outer membrane subunit [Yersinia enterocolitica]